MRSNSNSGQIAVALMVSMSMFIGGTALWGYMQQVNSRAQSSRSTTRAQAIAAVVGTRIKNLLAREGAAGCTSFSQFRDFRQGLADPVVQFNPATPAAIPSTAQPCILTDAEAAQLSDIDITVARVGQPSLTSLLTRVRVDITAVTIGGNGAMATTARVSRMFILRIAQASFFNLMIMPYVAGAGAGTPPSFPLIEVSDPTAGLEINGVSYYAGTTPIRLSEYAFVPDAGNSPRVFFNRPVLFRAATVKQEAAGTVDMAFVKRAYRAGVQAGILSNVMKFPLPFDDNVATTQAAWERSDAYRTLYNGQAIIGPLPDLSYLNAVLGGTVRSFVDFTNAPTQDYDPSNAADLADAAITEIPDTIPGDPSHPVAKGIPSLDRTCDSAMGGTVDGTPLFVFQRFRSDLIIDFRRTTPAGGTGLPIFCGLIAANQLTVRTPTAGNYYLMGMFYVTKLRVVGPGKVFIVNPADNISPPGMQLPVGQNIYNLYVQMMSLMASRAHNFFLPLFWNLDAAKATYAVGFEEFFPQTPDDGLGLGVAKSYMEPCQAPATATDRCLKTAPQPPDYSRLFPGGETRLAYMVEETL